MNRAQTRVLRWCAAAALAAVAAAAALDRLSPLAASLRAGRPEAVLLSADGSEFLFLRGPSSPLVHVAALAAPSSEQAPLRLSLPGGMSDEALRAGLDRALRDPLFWPRLPARLLRRVPAGRRYDALLAAWALQRAGPEGVFLWRGPGSLAMARERAQGVPEPPGTSTLEVLNASGADGLAWKAAKALRWRGVDVVHLGNADSVERTTRFLDRTGRPRAARAAAAVLGCGGAPLVVELEAEPRASLTVVLGEDYARCRGLETEVPL